MSSAIPDATFAFDPDSGALNRVPGLTAPDIVDSFLVRDGRVRGFDRHVNRFAAACAQWAGIDIETVRRFAEAARVEISVTDSWFPRFELLSGVPARLALRLRGAPPLRCSALLWLPAQHVGRQFPALKGPDLARLNAFRADAQRAGADEAAITSNDGYLLESSQSNLLWWRGDTLCTTPDEPSTFAGVTRDLLLAIAERRGVRVARERARPADLDGMEVWMVNALHGVRLVTGWIGASIGVPAQAAGQVRADHWRLSLADEAGNIRRAPNAGEVGKERR